LWLLQGDSDGFSKMTQKRNDVGPKSPPDFAAKLKELRVKREWTQAQLAAEAGLSQQAIAAWERGKREPGLLALGKLCAALGVPCTAFIPRENRPARKKGSS
jgi:transcriptional regulator with XRE-family HTH domain